MDKRIWDMFARGRLAPSEIDRLLDLPSGTAHDVISYRVWPSLGVRGPRFDRRGLAVFIW